MATLNINTDAMVVHANRLEKISRSALPVAVRGSVNSAAFNVKQQTMPLTARNAFTQRNKTFFKANSRVVMATGFNVNKMKAIIGFNSAKLKGGNNFAVSDLEQQEIGGKIKKKSFIPMDSARGGSNAKPVRPSNRLSRISRIINSTTISGGSRKQRYIKAALRAGKGGFVLGNFPSKTLYKITSIQKRSGAIKIRSKALYSFEKGRSVNVGATGFMKIATLRTSRRIEFFFKKEAKRQFKKIKR